MANLKREMRSTRQRYKIARREQNKTFNQARQQVKQVFKLRQSQANQLFAHRPDQLQAVSQQLKLKQSNDLQKLKSSHQEAMADHKQAYVDHVLTTPSQALTARELKKYKLPHLKQDHQEAKERFVASKKALRQEQNKAFLNSVFSYGRSEKQETNFGSRQRNFQPYQDQQSTVYVHRSTSERAVRIFSQAKTKTVSFKRQPEEQADSLNQQKSHRFKRTDSVDSHIKHSKSGRFFYDSDTLKEKKAEVTKAKAEFKSSQSQLKQSKRSYRYKRPQTKVLRAGRFLTRELVSEADDLASMRDLEHTARKSQQYAKFSYKGTTGSVKTIRGTYRFGRHRVTNLAERTRNFKAGKGFKLNDPSRHLNQRARSYLRHWKERVVKSYQNLISTIRSLPELITNVFFNPMTWWIAGGGLFLMIIISMFISINNQVLIQQDEFELNKAYTHMTLQDAENSISNERGTVYYTKIDDVMAYMNYKFQDYELADKVAQPTAEQLANLNSTSSLTSSTSSQMTYQDYLTELWADLNGGDKIKSMAELYKENKYALSKEEQDELREYRDEGTYLGLFELDNPFQGQGDDDVLTMLYRYGYHAVDGKPEKSNHIILQAAQGQAVVAPMDGLVKLDGNDVLIVSGEGKIVEARLRLKDIANGSVQNGQKVYSGEVVGAVQSDQGLTVLYQKYNDSNEKMVYVNPAFYFPHVAQMQTTIIASIGQFQGDEVGRAKQVYDYLKAEGASNQFIAAVLGNWSVESAVTAKRAEGDYLNPPIGATDTSWDDPSWLALGGFAIYNGGYSNIIHRGLGLGQWTDTADGAVRHTLLRTYADSKGKKWYDLELQLDFMLHGDSPYYTNWVAQHMKDTGSPAALAQLFLIYWEGNAGDKLIERQTRAIEWFYQIEKGFAQAAAGTAKVDPKTLDSIRGDLYNGVIPGDGNDMGYPWGQCTWYTAKRINQLGLTLKGRDGSKVPIISVMGNGMDWVGTAARLGGETGSTPRDGAIVSFNLGDAYGHVGFVEKVYSDGSFLVSEANFDGSAYNPTGNITFRKLSGVDASMSFAYTVK
ncbi:phage tail tip lysozyme [Streptococcus sp. E17BB]|uniref:phage tail tip lysozyme n=1 Tax=Streptococcus sp. E17BB TaxID=3278714 RepID=UPI00359E862E